ncbi:hypothetical protein GSQ51_21180, partial [Clostridioides difficile]|nr:hypothetical protein [Clostridioides difficile]
TIEVTYQVKVNSVPTPNIVYNQSDLVYSYQPDPNNSELKGSILFQSKINSLPPSTNIDNSSCVSFGYRYNQYGYIREKTIFSN